MRVQAWHVPLRLVTGAFILNSGLGKRNLDEERAKRLRAAASTAFPILWFVDARVFARLLSAGEIALGSALLLPVVPAGVAGAGLAAFSAGLLRVYLRQPEMHLPGSIRPSPQGTGLAKDVWMLGIGLALVLDGLRAARRRPSG